jgi:hypothetical protein
MRCRDTHKPQAGGSPRKALFSFAERGSSATGARGLALVARSRWHRAAGCCNDGFGRRSALNSTRAAGGPAGRRRDNRALGYDIAALGWGCGSAPLTAPLSPGLAHHRRDTGSRAPGFPQHGIPPGAFPAERPSSAAGRAGRALNLGKPYARPVC